MGADTLALVATVRRLDASFRTWIDHHRSHGFRAIYLVFDAPAEDRAWIEEIRDTARFAGVHCIENDVEHQRQVRALPQYAQLARSSERTVVHRQRLNAAVVMRRAKDDGVDWLLHLDGDELLAPYGMGPSIAEYFERLPAHYDEVIFPNFEAVPESEEIADPFIEVTLFKKSPYYLRYQEFEHLYTAWHGTSGTFKLFNAYITGKSALRMRGVDVPFVPASVHHFLPFRFNRNVRIEDDRGPIVLHYALCGLQRFVDRFTGCNRERVNTYDGRGFVEDLYLAAAECVAQGREGDLPALYRRLVMLEDESLRGRLGRLGLLMRRAAALEGPHGPLPASSFDKDAARLG